MQTTLNKLLKKNPVFSHLEDSVLERVLEIGVAKKYQTDEILLLAGDVWPNLFLQIEGRISVFKESYEGRGLLIAEFGEGDLFWGSAFFHEEARNPVTMRFTQDSLIYRWSREQMLPILTENGAMTWELARLMSTRMINASEIITGLAFRQVGGRLAQFLLKYPGQTTTGPVVRSLTLDEMANRIGSTREMVCRFLQGFAHQGLINITRTEFEIVDREGLMNLAQKEKP